MPYSDKYIERDKTGKMVENLLLNRCEMSFEGCFEYEALKSTDMEEVLFSHAPYHGVFCFYFLCKRFPMLHK